MAEKLKFLTAEWRNLIMANYEVPPDLMTEFLPHKTELDLFNSKCYVSLVGFMFLNTKILGLIPFPNHVNFEEVNLRFYVNHKRGNEIKRGVTFIKEIVPRTAIKLIANSLYSEKYDAMPMKHECIEKSNEQKVSYSWKFNGNWNYIKADIDKGFFMAAENSEEEFITEHYWGYTKVTDTKTSEYRVKHPKWRLHSVNTYEINCDFGKLYGENFSFLNNAKPVSVFLAEGSEISVHQGSKV